MKSTNLDFAYIAFLSRYCGKYQYKHVIEKKLNVNTKENRIYDKYTKSKTKLKYGITCT